MMINYNNKRFRVVETSGNGEVSTSLVFRYKQSGTILTCEYEDGAIRAGHLLGTVIDTGQINLSYHQVNTLGELQTGMCISTPELLPNGKVRIHESWQWTSGDKSKGQSILEEI